MFRPPARELCLNALQDVYQTCKFLSSYHNRQNQFTNMKHNQMRNLAHQPVKSWPNGDPM